MSIQYKDVVPWGRNFDEYSRMFNLTEWELRLRILGCGDGPASFNVECNQRGGQVISIDPLYHFSLDAIEKRIAEIESGEAETTSWEAARARIQSMLVKPSRNDVCQSHQPYVIHDSTTS